MSEDQRVGRRPDPLDVLATVRHPDTTRVELDDRVVLRTPQRPEDRIGNAVHLTGPPPDADRLGAGLADARRRLADPRVTPRVVARAEGAVAAPDGADARQLVVLVLPDAAERADAEQRRGDVTVRVPTDDRAWHGVRVLRRHAAPVDLPGEAAARARGGRDGLLEWQVDGRRELVATGRARVAVGMRFGTPVTAGTLVWAPAVDVGADAAGLAVLTDLVVHPAHRGIGVAASVPAALVRAHLADFPRALVATVVPAALAPPLERRGWVVGGRLVEVAAGPDGATGTAGGPGPRR